MKAFITFLAISLFTLNAYAVNATHGMVLFGKEKLMGYHLPMTHGVHAYQVIFEYEVPEDMKEKILAAGEDDYLTFVPEPFDLVKFIASPHAITGDIYKGHFEQEGVLLFSNVTLNNPKLQYAVNIKKPLPQGNDFNSYKLAGTATDLYLIHLLDGGSKVDQIFKATLKNATPIDLELAQNAIRFGINNIGSKLFKVYDEAVFFVDLIDRHDPKCYPLITRACQATKILKLDLPELYFTDSVM